MLSFFGNHPFIHPAAAFYERPEPSSQPSLAPLFRLLDDFDTYHTAAPQPRAARRTFNTCPRPQQQARAPFTPKFDVRETATTYELHGELPGLQRENVQIEFVEPQTLVVRGRVERRYETQHEEVGETPAAPAAPLEEQNPAAEPEPEVEVEVDWEDVHSETSSTSPSTHSNYHRPTVEDDTVEGEESHSAVSTPRTVASETVAEAPKPTKEAPAAATPDVPKVAPAPTPSNAVNSGRFWLAEREVGAFSRKFSFAERVDQERVSATLENGILSVSVPKAPKHAVRRVIIF